MVFDSSSDGVTRYLKRIDVDDVPELPEGSTAGLIWSNLLFNSVDLHFTLGEKLHGYPEYDFFNNPGDDKNNPLLTPEIMFKEVFSHEHGRFRDWWYAHMVNDYLVLYSPYDPGRKIPVKAWRRYEQIWPKSDD